MFDVRALLRLGIQRRFLRSFSGHCAVCFQRVIRGKAGWYGVAVCSKIPSGFMNVVSDVAD